VRDAGCLMHPQPCAQKRVARPRTSLHSGGTGKPGNPARNGLLIIPCSPRGGAHCARHPADKVLSAPGWADEPPQDLTPASGAGPHGHMYRKLFSSQKPEKQVLKQYLSEWVAPKEKACRTPAGPNRP